MAGGRHQRLCGLPICLTASAAAGTVVIAATVPLWDNVNTFVYFHWHRNGAVMGRKSKVGRKVADKPSKWTIVDPSPTDLATKMSSQDSVTTQLSSPGVSREESILDQYFELLSQNNCDRAKELVDSEKDGHKFNLAASWGETLQCLSQLATAEKNYNHLIFLGQKRFTHIVRTKDSAKSIYSMLLQEFQRMEATISPAAFSRSRDVESDQLLAHISGQLCYFVRARMKMMEFYEQLASLGAIRQWVNFEDLVMMCEEIRKDYIWEFHHPLLYPLRAVCSFECDILCHLLRAQILMSTWSYLPCVLELYHAHSKLNSWSDMVPMKEVKTPFGRSSGKSSLPPLYNWLLKLKGILISKFGFYFYDTLAKQTIPADLKVTLSRCPEDFVGKVQAFQKKSDSTNVYLVLDAHGLTGHVRTGGYHHPDKYAVPLQGLETYTPIFSYPHERAISPLHWPNIVMMITSDSDGNKVKFFYDRATERRPHSSYFIVRVDTRISLVVISESKKSEKDSSINSFMMDMSAQLRCQNAMAGLKNFARS